MQRKTLLLAHTANRVAPMISWEDLKKLCVPIVDGGGRQGRVPFTVAGAVELWNASVQYDQAKTARYFGTGHSQTTTAYEPMTKQEYLDSVVRDALEYDLAVDAATQAKTAAQRQAKDARRAAVLRSRAP